MKHFAFLRTLLLISIAVLLLAMVPQVHANLAGSYARKADIESLIVAIRQKIAYQRYALALLKHQGKQGSPDYVGHERMLNHAEESLAAAEQDLRNIQARITKQLGEEAARAAAKLAAQEAAKNAARLAAQNAANAAARDAAKNAGKDASKNSSKDASKDSGHDAAQSAAHPASSSMMPHCFVAGTLVSTPSGCRAIEKIKTGDEVLSFNEHTGQIEPALVLRTWKSQRADLITLALPNGHVTCSQNHRFYTSQHRWLVPTLLAHGERIQCRDAGDPRHLHSVVACTVTSAPQTSPVNVYNLSVAPNTDYFVGADALLCHNVK